jgi:hypothetical protein
MQRAAMCYKCIEVDKTIAHYENIARSVGGRKILDSIDVMIAELEARKDALHPEAQIVRKGYMFPSHRFQAAKPDPSRA